MPRQPDIIIEDDLIRLCRPPDRDALLKWFEDSSVWGIRGLTSLDLGSEDYTVHHHPETIHRAILDRNLYGADAVQPVVFEERRRPSHKLSPLERMQQGQQARRALALKVR